MVVCFLHSLEVSHSFLNYLKLKLVEEILEYECFIFVVSFLSLLFNCWLFLLFRTSLTLFSSEYFRKELLTWFESLNFFWTHTFNLLCTSILLPDHTVVTSLDSRASSVVTMQCKDKKLCHWPNLLDLSQTDSLSVCPVLAAASYLRTLVTSRTWSLRCPGLAEDRGPRSSLQNLVLKSQFNETHLGHSVMKNNWRYGELGSMLASFHDLKTLTIRNWQSLEKIEENAFAGLFLCLFITLL